MFKIALTVIMTSLLLSTNLAKANDPYVAWFVVVGTSNGDPMKRDPHAESIWKKAEKCGLRTFADYSNKFQGFRSGYQLHILETFYKSNDHANRDLQKVKKCIPDAYIKKSRYSGE